MTIKLGAKLQMHILQPKHTKLKADEVDKLLKKYNCSLSQLPKISQKDPQVDVEGIEVGDVLKFERKTEEGAEEYFRVVV